MNIKYNSANKPISNVIFNINQGNLIIQPSFQRAIVWKNNNMRDELMKSIFLGFPIGVFTAYEDEEGKENIVDGLQRLDTIKSFVEGNTEKYYAISPKISNEIIKKKLSIIKKDSDLGDVNSRKILHLFNNSRGFRLKINNLPSHLQEILDTYLLNFNYVYNANAQEIRDYFIVVQNQEKLKAGEIIKSIENNEFVEFVYQFKNLNNQFKEISFDNNRQDFVKYCVNFVGLYQNKIKFGITDQIIIRYGKKMKITNDLKNKFQIFLSSFNDADFSINEYDRQFNKYAMKLLIGYAIKYSDKITSKSIVNIIQKLYFISEQLSKINSINQNRSKEVKRKYIDDLKVLLIVSKTSHTLNEVENCLEKLNHLFDLIDEKKLRYEYIKRFQKMPSKNIKIKKNGLKKAYLNHYKKRKLSERDIEKFTKYAYKYCQ